MTIFHLYYYFFFFFLFSLSFGESTGNKYNVLFTNKNTNTNANTNTHLGGFLTSSTLSSKRFWRLNSSKTTGLRMNFNHINVGQWFNPHFQKKRLICMAADRVNVDGEPSFNMSLLDEMQSHSKIILDTSHYKLIGDSTEEKKTKPLVSYVEEVTTNPTILWRSVQLEEYDTVVEGVVKKYRKEYKNKIDKLSPEIMENIVDDIAVEFALQLTKAIVSLSRNSESFQPQVYLQVDVRLRNDSDAIRKKAKKLVEKYKAKLSEYNLPPNSSLCIKIPGTYAAFKACKILETEDDVRVLMTAVTSTVHGYLSTLQKASYIAPYVGRVSDWHKKNNQTNDGVDHGIELVKEILYYYRKTDSSTQIMAASFRSVQQITALAGVHLLTIAPNLLEELITTKAHGNLIDTLKNFKGKSRQPFNQFPKSEKEFLTELRKDDCGYEVFEKSMDLFEEDILCIEKKVNDFFYR